jgi:HK97 family phage prohead protease
MEEKVIKETIDKVEKVEDRVIRFVGSTEKVDRDGDIIMAEGWNLKNYKKNPVVLINHQRPADAVSYAKTKKVWVDKNTKSLMFDIEFPPPEVSSVGDSLYKWFKWAGAGATSVGFLPNRTKTTYRENKDGTRTRVFNEQDLLELSLVSTPANATALMTNKSLEDAVEAKVIDDLELNELKKWFDTLEPVEEDEKDKEIEELKAQLEELKSQVEEQEQEDDVYKSIFDEYLVGLRGTEKDDHTETTLLDCKNMDEILNKLRGNEDDR